MDFLIIVQVISELYNKIEITTESQVMLVLPT
jgi:hypothetical protein